MKKNRLRSAVLSGLFLFLAVFTPAASSADVSICLVSPIGKEMVRSGETITIRWIADNYPVCAWGISFYRQWDGDSTETYIGSTYYQSEGSYTFSAPYTEDTDSFRVIAKLTTDGSGICAETVSGLLTLQPSGASKINLTSPKPNPCSGETIILSGGDTYEVTWDAVGCDSFEYVRIFYSLDDGNTWNPAQKPGGGLTLPPYCYDHSFSWAVPEDVAEDKENSRIKIEWSRPGLTAEHQYPFTITPSPVNECPQADAGEDQTVNELTRVYLNGGGSSDPEGDPMIYHWEILNPTSFYESQVVLEDASTSTPEFVAPNVPVEIELEFRLTVSAHASYPCTAGTPDSDIVRVTVRPLSVDIDYFTPTEGWFKTPVTVFGDNFGGSHAYLRKDVTDTEVSGGPIPYEDDDEFTFFVPNLSLDDYQVKVRNDIYTYYPFTIIDTPYQWQYGFQFINPGSYDLTWDDYVRAFGYNAVTWEHTCCDWDGWSCERHCHSPLAQAIFDGYVDTMARPGTCWGMSAASLEFLYGDLTLPYNGRDEVRDLVWGTDVYITREIKRLHITQLSAEVISYLIDHLSDRPSDHVARVMADTEDWRDKSNPDYTPGIISIQNIVAGSFDGFAGHALVPDHVEEVSSGLFRIYVYDSNREGNSTSMDNTNTAEYADITDWENYPYIEVDTRGTTETWSFVMAGGDTWTASSSHNLTISSGGSEMDIPFYGLYYFPAGVSVRDHYTFPTSARGIGMILFGSADSGLREPDGDVLGYDSKGGAAF